MLLNTENTGCPHDLASILNAFARRFGFILNAFVRRRSQNANIK